MSIADILSKVPIIGWIINYKRDTLALKFKYQDQREKAKIAEKEALERQQALASERRLLVDAQAEEFLKNYAEYLSGLTNLQVMMEPRLPRYPDSNHEHIAFAASANNVYELERDKRKVLIAEHLVKLLNSTDEEVLLMAESMKERRISEDYVEATREEARNRVANRVGVRTLRRLIDEEKQKLKARL